MGCRRTFPAAACCSLYSASWACTLYCSCLVCSSSGASWDREPSTSRRRANDAEEGLPKGDEILAMLPVVWFCIVAVMVAIYAVLDGFDLGAGIVRLCVARTAEERRLVLQSIDR